MHSRYLIVENHPLYAEALLNIVRGRTPDADVTIVRTIKDAAAAASRGKPYDLMLLDLRLPDANGFDGLIGLRILCPKLPIVVHAACVSERVKDKAAVFGATAYISKAAKRDAILDTLDHITCGPHLEPLDTIAALDQTANAATQTAPLQAAPLQAAAQIAPPVRNKSLTHQQLRVLQSICLGRQNKQIARELDIAETTIKAHVSEILRKLGVTSRTQAVLDVARLEKEFVFSSNPAVSTEITSVRTATSRLVSAAVPG